MRASARRCARRLAVLAGWVVLLALASAAHAVTYYVRTTGSDASSGLSPAAAWASVAHAANTVVAGDTVYVGAGTYTDAVDVQNSGTGASPIVFVADLTGAFTGDAGAVVVDAGAATGFTIDSVDDIQVIGLRVTGGFLRTFEVNSASGIVLRDCEIDGGFVNGLEIDTAQLTIESCDLHDHVFGAALDIVGNSDVSLADSAVRDNGDQGIVIDQPSAVLVARRCDVYGNGGEAIFIDRGSVELVNCLVRENASYGVWLDSNQADLVAWHSTIVGNGTDGVLQQQGSSTITNSIVANNGLDGLDRNGGTMVHSYNLFFGNGDQDLEGTAAGTGELFVDPLFVGGGDYHLDVGSPAVDAGTDASAVTSQDLEGSPRPSGAGWDLGAYERPSAAHFAIVHDGAGAGCVPEAVTLQKHDGTHALDTTYTGTVSLSTTTGNGTWSLVSGAGTLNVTGPGTADYSFALADAGQVVLGLQNPNPETVNIDASDGIDSEGPGEDPDLVFGGGTPETFRDEFGAVSYSNNDGTLTWSTPWIEVDGAGAGPGAGNARIVSARLRLEDFPDTGLDTSAEREADLSGFLSATFSFDFDTSPGVDASDGVFIEVSGDGGASWTILERIDGISGSTAGSRSYDISGFIASNTRVRFRIDGLNGTGGGTCCYGDGNERFQVDNVQIQGGSPLVCGPNHFSFAHDGSGINCQAETITLTAHDAAHGAVTDYTGTASLSTSTGHGDWSLVTGAGTLTNGGSGNATYTFDLADAGQVLLGLRDTFVETVDLNVVGDGAIESEDPLLVFDRAGFQFLADGVGSAIGTQIAGKPSGSAPGQTLELQAVRTSDLTGACEAAYQGAQNVELAFTCDDPSTCVGALLDVNGVAVAPNPAGPPGAYTTLSLDFGNATDTTAPLALRYDDVGRIQLHARAPLSPSGELLLGSSNAFVVRPFGFALAVPGNPGTTTPAGAVFVAAGLDFTVDVAAVLWQAADDADADGIADGHANADPLDNADLTDNAIAPSFGRETAPAGVTLAAALYAPAGGNDPGLAGATAVTGWVAGAASSPGVYFDEVGVAELSAAVTGGDYLGIGAAETARSAGRSGPVGRFLPDRLEATVDTAPVFATGCGAGGFTYQGEPFVFATAPVLRVTARSTRGTQTRNYTGAWWKLTNTTLANRAYPSDPGSPALDTSGLPPAASDPGIVDLGDGSGTLTFDAGSGLRFVRGATPSLPFDAEIALRIDIVDADGVGHPAPGNTFTVGSPNPGGGIAFDAGKEQRYGRLVLENAHGSELSPLPQPLRAEYWTAAGFAQNGADDCTVVPLVPGPPAVGTTARTPAALATSPNFASAALVSGSAGLFWDAPGVDGFADVLVNLSSADVVTPWGTIFAADMPWLQWDWAGDGAGLPDQSPAARITFGIDDPDRPVIFRREVY